MPDHNDVGGEITDGAAVAQETSVAYCDQLVRRHDPDCWFALRYAVTDDRKLLLAFAAWQIELRHVIHQVSTPPLGEIRLQWWRDALQEIIEDRPVRAHPVVQAMATAIKGSAVKPFSGLDDMAAAMETIISARARLLYEAPFRDCEDLFAWACESEGRIMVLAARGLEASEPFATSLAEPMALLNMARDGARLAPTLVEAIPAYVKEKWSVQGSKFQTVDARLMPLALPLGLIPVYTRSQKRSLLAIKRQGKYVKSVLTGRI